MKYSRKILIIVVVVTSLILNQCKPNKVTTVKDISDLRLVVVSKKCDKILYSSNTDDIYRPWLLQGAFGTSESNNSPLIIKSNLELFSRSISCDCKTAALFQMDKDQQGSKTLYLYDFDTHAIVNLNEKMKDKFGQSTLFSPTKFEFAYIDSLSKLQILNYKTYKKQTIPILPDVKFNDLMWSVKGKNIYLVDDSTNLWVYKLDIKKFSEIWKAPYGSSASSPRMLTPSSENDDVIYFRSDHSSNFMQVYKYDPVNGVHLLFPSYHNVSLLQIPVNENPFYYKEYVNGFVVLKKYLKGKNYNVFPNQGVVFNYFPGDREIFVYADHQHPFSIYENIKHSFKNLIKGMNDSMPNPIAIKNSFGVNNFVYFPTLPNGKWAVVIHGGPHQTILRKYDRFLSHLVKSGIGVIVLYYPGSDGMGKNYELIDNPNFNNIILKSIEIDLKQIKSKYQQIDNFSMIGISFGAIITHLYSLTHNDVVQLIDLSGFGNYAGRKNIPTLYVYGTEDVALDDMDRINMIEGDLKNGNGNVFKVIGEGHVIAHKKSVQAVLDRMANFIIH